MGWFGRHPLPVEHYIFEFSSPLGDGLVLHETYFGQAVNIFVPEWGWGWFLFFPHMTINRAMFSSPSGDGLVLQILTEILKN